MLRKQREPESGRKDYSDGGGGLVIVCLLAGVQRSQVSMIPFPFSLRMTRLHELWTNS